MRSSICEVHFRRVAYSCAAFVLVLTAQTSQLLGQTNLSSTAVADYRISVGDSLQLDFLDDDADAYPLDVGGAGEVQLPFLGTVALLGLRLDEARDAIANQYVEREILITPAIDLSVVNLRPFSVLGDVLTPGFFDYRPEITVEQAVGLAGGPIRAAGDEEVRSLQRAALRGELAGIEGAILREIVVAAGLRTQLAGGTSIDVNSIRTDDISDPDTLLLADIVTENDAVIAAEQSFFQAERGLVEQALVEVTQQVDLTEQQIVAQTAQIESYSAELSSSLDLTERGLMAEPVRARLLRQVADEQTALLRLRTNLAETQRLMTGLRRELLSLDYRRAQAWRTALAESGAREAQLQASRVSVLERLALLADWSRRDLEGEATTLGLLVRRRTPEGGQVTLEVSETDAMMPGDVLIVRIGQTGPILTLAEAVP